MSKVISIEPLEAEGSLATELPRSRYRYVSGEKAGGATYTPKALSDFVARNMLDLASLPHARETLSLLDPALGDGELLVSLLSQLKFRGFHKVEVHGFETQNAAIMAASKRLKEMFPWAKFELRQESFLDFVTEQPPCAGSLFASNDAKHFDLIIANPPYVRTQIMGAAGARIIAKQFALNGRVDLYHAFIVAMAQVLHPKGTIGVIVSNRFMTTKAGSSLREFLRRKLKVRHIWDLGDTKLFDAAVLPAVLLLQGNETMGATTPAFTSIYETTQAATLRAKDALTAAGLNGIAELDDGRRFDIKHGKLELAGGADGLWRLKNASVDSWLANVERRTWSTFGKIGRIRVGVKTCADDVFIRDDWGELPEEFQPELLRPLMTHHIARRFRARPSEKPLLILYPHQAVGGTRRAADLDQNPRAKSYLESHRSRLEERRYLVDSGREWYEIWVPQDPSAWEMPKLVFRDISKEPTFWMDLDGSIVNGDCYWLAAEHRQDEKLLWLAAAVGNSAFIEIFYDHRFNNKLYAGRRRFMTQYVEQFPLPDPNSVAGGAIILKAKALYDAIDSPQASQLSTELDQLVCEAFGLDLEKVAG